MIIAILAHLHHPIAEPYAGGTEMHTAAVADELAARGHDVVLFAKAGSNTRAHLVPVVEEDFVFGQPAEVTGRTSKQILTDGAIAAIAQILTGTFDVVLNNSLGPLPYRLLTEQPMLTVLHTPPTVREVVEVITAPDWRPDPMHRWVGVSETNTRAWSALLPHAVAVPNGIRLDGWGDLGHSESDLAVWSARITPEKGLHLAIDAARRAGMRLHICGPVANADYFADVIAPRLGGDVVHLGHLDHDRLRQELARGSVFISSSVWPEPFGLSLVEALACGTPVAAFDTGAASEIVTGNAGALARTETSASLAHAIHQARRCSRRDARDRAAQFDIRQMIDRYEVILRHLAGANVSHDLFSSDAGV